VSARSAANGERVASRRGDELPAGGAQRPRSSRRRLVVGARVVRVAGAGSRRAGAPRAPSWCVRVVWGMLEGTSRELERSSILCSLRRRCVQQAASPMLPDPISKIRVEADPFPTSHQIDPQPRKIGKSHNATPDCFA
jgi:hypothetical protein